MANKYLNQTGLSYLIGRLKSIFVGNVAYDSTNKKITKTINGTTTDVVTIATVKSALNLSKSDVGLGNVDNTADSAKIVAKAAQLTTTRYIDGVKFIGAANVSHYASCPTATGTSTKVATIDPTMTFSLVTGARVTVTFANPIYSTANTNNLTLNVNNTGAKTVFFNGEALKQNNALLNSLNNKTLEFVYDGTNWLLVGGIPTAEKLTSVDFGGTDSVDFVYNGDTYRVPTFSAYGNKTDFLESAMLRVNAYDPTTGEVTLANQLNDQFTFYTKNTIDLKANSNDPTFTGLASFLGCTTVKVPTVNINENNTMAASTEFVHNVVNDALAGVAGVSFEVVTSLPATGNAGKIYLKSNGSSSGSNIYDEYIYYNNKWELIGSTAVDMSGYLKTTDMVAITTAEIDALFA